MRATRTLTDTRIRTAKPQADGVYYLTDGAGLRLAIRPDGGKSWLWRYRLHGKEGTYSIGVYPAVGLADARRAADAARELVRAGKHPTAEKRAAKEAAATSAGNTFREVAAAWLRERERELADGKISEATYEKLRWLLEDVTPAEIADLPLTDITSKRLYDFAKRIADMGTREKAKRLARAWHRVFAFAVSTGRLDSNPASTLTERGILPAPITENRPAITDPARLGEYLRAAEEYDGAPITRIAMRLLPHLALRPGELRKGRWCEIDFDTATWTIPAAKMKKRRDHVVPLSRQVVAMLRELQALTGWGELMFPGVRSSKQPMSDGTLNAALRRMDFPSDEVVAHGFRSTASTLLNEAKLFDPDVIERQLAHVDSNAIRGIYDRSAHIEARRELLQWWSDRLDALRTAKNVSSLADARAAKAAEA